MITEITGDSNTFRAMMNGAPDLLTQQYCLQVRNQAMQNYDVHTRQFFENQGQVFQPMDFKEINRMAKALVNQQESGWMTDTIQPLTTIAQIQHAPPTMMQWIMAEPTIRQRYYDQTIAGYDDYYVDPTPNRIADTHQDYRLAMNGLVVEGEDGEMQATEWFNDEDQHRLELDIVDQAYIQRTWQAALAHLNHGTFDPTSRFNATL